MEGVSQITRYGEELRTHFTRQRYGYDEVFYYSGEFREDKTYGFHGLLSPHEGMSGLLMLHKATQGTTG